MSNYTEALAFAASYCSSAEHCKSEILDKTTKFKLTFEEKFRMIQRLQQDGFLDEKRYVKAFVNDRFRFNKWGHVKIRFILRQKGISPDLIEDGMGLIPEDEYQEMLQTLLNQKKTSIKSKSNYELKGKLLRYAAGRGFESELISRCLKYMDINEHED